MFITRAALLHHLSEGIAGHGQNVGDPQPLYFPSFSVPGCEPRFGSPPVELPAATRGSREEEEGPGGHREPRRTRSIHRLLGSSGRNPALPGVPEAASGVIPAQPGAGDQGVIPHVLEGKRCLLLSSFQISQATSRQPVSGT